MMKKVLHKALLFNLLHVKAGWNPLRVVIQPIMQFFQSGIRQRRNQLFVRGAHLSDFCQCFYVRILRHLAANRGTNSAGNRQFGSKPVKVFQLSNVINRSCHITLISLLFCGSTFARCDVVAPRPGHPQYPPANPVQERTINENYTYSPTAVYADESDTDVGDLPTTDSQHTIPEVSDKSETPVVVEESHSDDATLLPAQVDEAAAEESPNSMPVENLPKANETTPSGEKSIADDEKITLATPEINDGHLQGPPVPQVNFEVYAGTTFKETLIEWAHLGDLTLVWNATGDYEIAADFSFGSDLEAALLALFNHFPEYGYSTHVNALEVHNAR